MVPVLTSGAAPQSSGSSNCAQMSYEEPQSEPLAESSSAPAPLPAQARDKGPLPAYHYIYRYDFVERPPMDFFCPVSYELMLDPQQSQCCGQHFTREVAERIKSSGRPCPAPMCQQDELISYPDRYLKKKVSQLSVRCLHKEKGDCEWVGELSDLSDHAPNCPKQPWECPHCEFAGLKEVEHEHLGTFHS